MMQVLAIRLTRQTDGTPRIFPLGLIDLVELAEPSPLQTRLCHNTQSIRLLESIHGSPP